MRPWSVGLVLVLSACGTPYYEPCGVGATCPGGYVCADPGRIDVCTIVCREPSDCAGIGPRSFCSIGGVCLERCDRDADCPISSYCDVATNTCSR